MESGAIDDNGGLEIAGCRAHYGAANRRNQRLDTRMHHDLTAPLQNAVSQSCAHLLVIHDPRLRYMNRSHAGSIWFKFRQPTSVDDLTLNPVGLAALIDSIQRGQLRLSYRDDDLAANLVIHPLGFTEILHRLFAGAAVDRTKRPWLVIDPRMQHARIAPSLMKCQLRLFFQ